MDTLRQPVEKPAAEVSPALLAKGALRRLASERLEPTPENYARCYRLEAGHSQALSVLPARAQRLVEALAIRAFDGDAHGTTAFNQAMVEGRWDDAERAMSSAPGAAAEALAVLIERILRGVERGGQNWTMARRKVGVKRVLDATRTDSRRLQHRLSQLVASWDSDPLSTLAHLEDDAPAKTMPADLDLPAKTMPADLDTPATVPASLPAEVAVGASRQEWVRITHALTHALQQALPAQDGANQELVGRLEKQARRLADEGATTDAVTEFEALCQSAGRVLQHRHHLFDQLGKLTLELTGSLTDLAENDSWVKGQCEAMRLKIEEGLTARGVRSVSDMLHNARKRHGELRGERERARDALKVLINRMLGELGELGSKTGSFHESVGRYATVIEEADTLESLTGVVREMVEESRTVQSLVQQTQTRLQQEHTKATGLSERVNQLEGEMKRLSDEVSTDQLTQIANRRGLMMAFETERARMERSGEPLAIGLLDIDNFKRLNDELGHSAGDEALKSLAAVVSKTLRPTDRVARYGGEEFVVLLPATQAEEGQQILTRLQRTLTGGLFMHKDKNVFVTFSAGVTAYDLTERIEEALERADQALYEAKRTGKNRTCLG